MPPSLSLTSLKSQVLRTCPSCECTLRVTCECTLRVTCECTLRVTCECTLRVTCERTLRVTCECTLRVTRGVQGAEPLAFFLPTL